MSANFNKDRGLIMNITQTWAFLFSILIESFKIQLLQYCKKTSKDEGIHSDTFGASMDRQEDS